MELDDATLNDNPQEIATPLLFAPLSPSFGAQVSGVDLSKDIPESVKPVLRQALFDHQILLFRGQELDEDRQVRAAQVFGTCRVLWQNPHYPSENHLAHYLSNIDAGGDPINRHPDPDSIFWHTDGSWSRRPALATVLYGIQVPKGAGTTHFANMYELYNSLDRATRNRLELLKAEHHLELTRAARQGRYPWQWGKSGPNRPSTWSQLNWWTNVIARRLRDGAVYHPVVRVHPETGRPALFIGDHAWRIAGRPWSSGIREMKKLNELEPQSAAVYSHEWQPGDLLVWDNGSVLHRVGAYDLINHVRVMRRCVVEA